MTDPRHVIETTAAPSPTVRVPAATEPLVSIVIVTYGTGPIVVDALAGIAAHTPRPYEVIVVDNPPSAGEPAATLLRAETAGVILATPDENLGFGGGNDLGVEIARGSIICFLNPDVIVGDGWLPPLLAALDDPVVAVAAPVLLDPDGTLQEAGQVIYDDGCTAAIGGPELFTGDLGQAFDRDVDYASAACWLVRRDEHVARGGFDPRYHPAFFEDSDYGLRVELGGQRTRLVADVPVVHLRGGGGAGRDLEMSGRSLEVFRSIWQSRLTGQLPRPTSPADALASRDRLAAARSTWVDRTGGESQAEARRALAEAAAHAEAFPRERVSYLTTDATGLDVRTARCSGVEVVIGDVDSLVGERAELGGTWHDVQPTGRGARSAARALLSPWTLLVGLVGIVIRVVVLRSPSGALNSDEAYTGLQAMGVLDGRFPVVVDGNRYSAVIDSYLFAPVVGVAGPSILLLKLIPIVFFAVAAVLTYFVGSYLADRRVGAVAGAFVWITPGALLVVSTLAYVGYALGMAVCVATLWFGARLIDGVAPDRRLAAATGGCAGLALYVHPMYVAVLLPILVPVAWAWRRHLRAFWAPFVGAGVAVNLPFLAWNAVNGWPSLDAQNSLPGTYTDRLSTFARELVPRGYGLRDSQFDWVFGRGLGLVAYGVLVGAAAFGALTLLRASRRRSRVLVPSALVFVWPMMALFSPLIWSQDGRYNVIAFPIVALAVASSLTAIPISGRSVRTATAVAAVAVWGAVLMWPHLDRAVAWRTGDANAELYELVDRLDGEGIDRVAGSYWRVLTIEYASDRRIIGAVTPPFPIRFPERQRTVESSPAVEVAFVFPLGAEDEGRLWLAPDAYERVVVGDTVIYLPLARS